MIYSLYALTRSLSQYYSNQDNLLLSIAAYIHINHGDNSYTWTIYAWFYAHIKRDLLYLFEGEEDEDGGEKRNWPDNICVKRDRPNGPRNTYAIYLN